MLPNINSPILFKGITQSTRNEFANFERNLRDPIDQTRGVVIRFARSLIMDFNTDIGILSYKLTP